jgi:hypothetical protein
MKKLSNLVFCSKFRSNLHQYHIFLNEIFYFEKDINIDFSAFYRFGLLRSTQNIKLMHAKILFVSKSKEILIIVNKILVQKQWLHPPRPFRKDDE